MEFFRRPAAGTQRLGILSGTFNPPTRAHLALGEAGLAAVDEVLFVMPRILPHKTYEGVSFPDRLRMLQCAISGQPRFSVAATEKGLFVDIARECRAALGPKMRLMFLCGRDAAERAITWDYGRPSAFLDMLQEFDLLVASRKGSILIPAQMAGRIFPLQLSVEYDGISATEVRRRIQSGEPWEQLVPETVAPLVRELYGK